MESQIKKQVPAKSIYLTMLIACCTLSGCSWSNVNSNLPQTRNSTSQPSVNSDQTIPPSATHNSPAISSNSRPINSIDLLIQVLQRQVGRPYLYGGSSPNGFDCSGLVQYSFAQIGINLPRSTQEQMGALQTIEFEQLQAGDLAFFQTGNKQYHVAIMTDNHNFIHAPSSGKSVSEANFSNQYWQKTFIRAARFAH